MTANAGLVNNCLGRLAVLAAGVLALSALQVVAVDAAPAARGCTIVGTSGPNRLVGDNGRDSLCGKGGNDRLIARGGKDRLRGASGNDRLVAGKGRDVAAGGPGNDVLIGGPGNDRLNGRDADRFRDVLRCGPGKRDKAFADPGDVVAKSCEIVVQNDPPTGVTLSPSSVEENEPAGTEVGALSASDPDPGDAHEFELVAGAGADDNGDFHIAGSDLETATSFDFEVDNELSIRVRATDEAGESFEQILLVSVSDVAEGATAPVIAGIETAALAYTENDPATPVTASATVSDADSSDFNTGVLTVDLSVGGQAEDRLTIRNQGTGAGQIGVSGANVTFGGSTIGTSSGGTGSTPLVIILHGNATPTALQALVRNITYRNASDAPSTAGRTVRFVLTDGDGGTSAPATREVSVAAVDDAPVAVPDSATVAQDAGATAIAVLGNDTDVDGGPKTIASATDPANGTVALTGGPAGAHTGLNYAPDAGYCNSTGGGSDSFIYTLNGGSSATVSITVTCASGPSNVAPVIAAIEVTALGYTENDPATVITATGTVTDVDSADLNNGVLTVDLSVGGAAEDRLAIRNQGNGAGQIGVAAANVTYGGVTIGTFTGGTGTTPLMITLDADATPAAAEALVRNITYRNASDAPSTTDRTARFVLTDGDGGTSNAATRQITITAVDDNPIAMPDTATVAQDSAAAAVTVLTNDTDVDGGPKTIASATHGTHGTVQLTGGSAGAHTGLTYQPDFGYCNSTGSPDTFTYTLNGGSLATVSMTVTCPAPVNVAPVIANLGPSTFGYTENDPATVVTPSATVTDADSANFAGGTLTVDYSAGGQAEDRLEIRNVGTGAGQIGVSGPNVTYGGTTIGTFTGGTGTTPLVITLDADATPAAAQELVRNITYRNVSDAPSTTTRTVRFVLTDGDGGTSNAATRSINVTTVDDNPIAMPDTATVAQDSAAAAVIVLTNDTDVDGGPKTIASATDPTHGAVVLTGGPPATGLTYQPDPGYCNSTGGGADTFTYTLNGGSFATVSMTVTCPAATAAPVVTLNTGSLPYNENAAATVISPALTVTDADSANLTGATIQITVNYANPEDVLSFTAGSGIVGSFDGGTGTLTLTGTATVTQYQAVLRTVRYQNLSDSPSTANRTVTFLATDGANTSVPQTRTITVAAVNDPPSITDASVASTYAEQNPASAPVTPSLTVTDMDNASLTGATITITTPIAGDELTFTDQNGIAGSFVSGVLTLTGTATKADYQTALRSIGFKNGSSNNPGATRAITVRVTDGIANSNTLNRSITITAVNDPPVNTVPGTQTGTEDIAKVFSFSVADPDATTVRVALTAANGTITLSTTAGLTINSGANGSGAVTFTGTITAVNTAMTGMSFLGTANYNVGHAFDSNLSIVTSDQGQTGTGGTLTDTDTTTINLAAVNDAPVAVTKNLTVQTNMGLNDVPNMLVGVTDPDSGDPGYTAGLTLTTVTPLSCAGCTITDIQSAAGTFDLDIGAGLSGAHTLQYTVTDNGSPVGPALTSAPATINLTVSGRVIWFVNDNAAAGGDGTMSAPFQTIAQAVAVDQPTDQGIFLFEGTYAHGITLLFSEQLIGQGYTFGTFDGAFGITPPANTPSRPAIGPTFTRPTISNNVSFGAAQGDLRGVNLTPASAISGLTGSGGLSGLNASQVSITANAAPAVNLNNVSGNFTFTEIDATGGTSGIVWTNSSAQSGILSVTGTGTADCTTAANCTGGAIQNMTGPGIVLSNTSATVSFANMLIQNGGDDGIRATTTAGINLTNLFVNNNGDAANEDSLDFVNTTGTGSLAASVLDEGGDNNLNIEQGTGALTFSVTGNVIRDTEDSNGSSGDGLGADLTGSGTLILNVTGANTFADSEGDHIQVSFGAAATGGVTATIDGNTFTNDAGGGALGSGLTLGGSGSSQNTYVITNNTITGAVATSIGLGGLFSTATQLTKATISNNIIGSATLDSGGTAGISVSAATLSETRVSITNNQIRNWNNPAGAIRVLSNDTCGGAPSCVGSGGVNATITGNTIANGGTFSTHGLNIEAGDSNYVCASIGGSTAALKNNVQGNESAGGTDIRVRQAGATSTFRMPGYTGAANGGTTQTDVTTYLSGRNTMTSASVAAPGGAGYLNTSPAGSACVLP